MKTGLFFGSFNPIHTGHLLIANYFIENGGLNEIWFVISPRNPFKEKDELLNENIRFELVKIAIQGHPKFKVIDVEFKLPKPSYTYNTLLKLRTDFPDHTFIPIMGGDNLQTFHLWKNYDGILNNHEVYVYDRAGFNGSSEVQYNSSLKRFEVPLLDISSTYIREAIQAGKSVRYLLPREVEAYIKSHGLYQ